MQTSQQLGRYLDIKIKLGRAGSLSSTSSGRIQQPKVQVMIGVPSNLFGTLLQTST